MDKDIVSIIIATKNGGRFLPRAIASIEKQTEKNVEVIIVSDGSTDDTVSIAQELAKTRPFIKVIPLEKNVGPGLARNVGIKEATGKYIAILDDDDEWINEGKLKTQIKFLDEHPEYVLVGASETDFVDEDKKLLFIHRVKTNDAAIRSRILISDQFVTSSVMFRKDVFEKVGGFPPMYLAEDYDLWLRLTKEGKVANLQGCKTRYYNRSSGAFQKNKKLIAKIVLELNKKYKNDFPHPRIAMAVAYIRILIR